MAASCMFGKITHTLLPASLLHVGIQQFNNRHTHVADTRPVGRSLDHYRGTSQRWQLDLEVVTQDTGGRFLFHGLSRLALHSFLNLNRRRVLPRECRGRCGWGRARGRILVALSVRVIILAGVLVIELAVLLVSCTAANCSSSLRRRHDAAFRLVFLRDRGPLTISGAVVVSAMQEVHWLKDCCGGHPLSGVTRTPA